MSATHATRRRRRTLLLAAASLAGGAALAAPTFAQGAARPGAAAPDTTAEYDVVIRGGRVLDLTFKEFELLKYLAQHPGRVFTRDQLLQEVWGYDYFGGTRTVDVHVRRLRAKLGTDNEMLIGTVRNVGYRFVLPSREQAQDNEVAQESEQVP